MFDIISKSWLQVSAAEVEEVGSESVSGQTMHSLLHIVGLHGRCPRRKTLLKLDHEKCGKQFAKDHWSKSIDYLKHGL